MAILKPVLIAALGSALATVLVVPMLKKAGLG